MLIKVLGVDEIADDEDDDHSVEDGAEATAADSPFAGHWNAFDWCGQERPALVDCGYDDDAVAYWNNQWWNNARYNAGTSWHDLINMFCSGSLERQRAEDEELEERGIGGSAGGGGWNMAEWSEAAALPAAFGALDAAGDLAEKLNEEGGGGGGGGRGGGDDDDNYETAIGTLTQIFTGGGTWID